MIHGEKEVKDPKFISVADGDVDLKKREVSAIFS
jgi:hypothetical protein